MKLLASILTVAGLLAAAIAPTPAGAFFPAQGNFGINSFDNVFTNEDGTMATQAGSHAFASTVSLGNNLDAEGNSEGWLKDLDIEVPSGLVADTTAYPRCGTLEFLQIEEETGINACPIDTSVGVTGISVGPGSWFQAPVFNLTPPPGVLVRLGFRALVENITIDLRLSTEPPYVPVASVANAPQLAHVYASKTQLWGDPASPAHDELRGSCASRTVNGLPPGPGGFQFESQTGKTCPVAPRPKPFLTVPTNCAEALRSSYRAISWEGEVDTGSVLTHDALGNPQPFTGCGKLGFSPAISSEASSENAETGTGLEFSVDFNDEGLTNLNGLAQSHVRKAVVTLPQGLTINPSVGEGLAVCTPAQLGNETLHSAPGEGCPNASKLGVLDITSPLTAEPVGGSVFLAQQDDPGTTQPGAENPFDSLIALYLVIRNTDLGVIIKLPLKVEPDPNTGQLIATLDNVPQLPVSHFGFRFKEGARAPLITPSACGTYTTKADFYPWSDPTNPHTVTSSFEINKGIGAGPCPPGGIPPFNPDFQAGAINNNAGSFSPFNMRLIRSDGEQDMTKFSSVLPPGELGSLAGVSKCPDSAIAIARAKQGREEIASPSCPANSLIGHTLAGAGVGEALTYVGGQIYLGGAYHGDPLSVISVTPAVAGPFDAGTVVVRLALTLNPKTAEVEVDGANSDPIPHILKGIVLKVRDLRVYVDRPNFTLNPTSCEESSAKARLFGSYLNVFDPADDVPVDLSTRYQAANCLNLGFKPKLALNLKGGTKRGGHPGLSAIYTPRKGDANVKGLVVRLPRSAFLDQAHIRTICTRVQFAADACPPAAQYGYIRAWTPLLDEPLQGPVWLRSSSHKLPDLVFDLHGLVDVEVSTRIDSAHGGIRATLEQSPDAPLSKVVLQMQGGKKGLIVNSRDLCAHKSRAEVAFTGHNGKRSEAKPAMRPQCGGKGRHKGHRG
jgi:hypothetical protein